MTVSNQADPSGSQRRHGPAALVSYHVALDTLMGRRSHYRPEEVAIDGFLLLDTGEYKLVTAYITLDVFWKMKVLDIVGHVRTENRARAARSTAYPHVGSVWLVDGELKASATASPGDERVVRASGSAEDHVLTDRRERVTDAAKEETLHLQVHTVYSLDRVAIESDGPRFIETLHVRDMLPAFSD